MRKVFLLWNINVRNNIRCKRGINRLNILNRAKNTFSVGRPVSSRILSIWFRVEVPGNRDFPVINSPNIHPTDHISTALEYLVDPNKISGARYHLVATYSVRTGSPWFLQSIDRASPKSATFAWHSELSSKLLGLRSRWINSPECINFNAFSSWYTINFLWISSKIPARMTTCKSASRATITCLHKIEHQIQIFIIFGFDDVKQSNYVFMTWITAKSYH